MYDIIYAQRSNKKTLVLEALNYGGQILNAPNIENYPAAPNISGFDFSNNIYNQAKELGAEIKIEKAIDIELKKDYKIVKTNKEEYQTKAIILATGADNRKLELENEEKLLGKGISYCATCDGAFYKNKIVAVAGGGNTALEDAIYLSNIAEKVYLIHRRDTFKAEPKIIKELEKKKNIEIIFNSNITKLNSNNNKLSSIEITNIENQIQELNINGLFIAVGRVPENQNFATLINLDDKGYIIATENCHTNIEGIYAAGDNRQKDLRQLVTATSDGAIAATEAIKYINNQK